MEGQQFLTQLTKKLQTTGVDEELCAALTQFLTNADVPSLDKQGIENLRLLLDAIQDTVPGAIPLQAYTTALQRYKQPTLTLTPIHPYLARYCCWARCYAEILPLLQETIQYTPKSHHLIYQDHLVYHFYGALCCAALQNYSRAYHMLRLVLVAGGHFTSLIQVEAYKKYLLIELILHGEYTGLPEAVPQQSKRTLEQLTSAYTTLAEAYTHNNLQEVVQANAATFINDGNKGLVNTALATLPEHHITRLTKVYSTISLERLSQTLDLEKDATESILMQMMKNGKVNATIQEGTVCFANEVRASAEQLRSLSEQRSILFAMKEQLGTLQKSIDLDPDRLTKSENDMRRNKGKHRAFTPAA